jgi:hypothetical protein
MAVILGIIQLDVDTPFNCQVRAVSRELDCLVMTNYLKLNLTFGLVNTVLDRFLSSKGILIANYCDLSPSLLDFQLLSVGLRITIIDASRVRPVLHSLIGFVFWK